MHPNQLQDTAVRYFLEVVRSGSLTEASSRLHVAASAISRQIAGLEQSLGTVLFERQPRGMVPTAAGEILAAHARRASLDAEHALEEIMALQGLRSGRVRLATSEGFAAQFLPPLIVEFRERYQRISFQVSVESPANVPVRIRDGDADIGLTFSRAAERDIRVEHRQPSPVLALVPPGHALAGAKAVTLRSLSAYPMALPLDNTTIRQMIDIACSRQQLLIEPVLSTNYMSTLVNFVLEGGGISVAGEVSVRQLVKAGRLVAIPIRDHGMELRDIELQTLAGRTLPHAAQSFLDHLKLHLPG
ncbi:MAG: LysR family transcriptional regulator [Comamonadaceae bacterium]|nr:MAG: LysR family transcriptional regulator [Comamonadaceae bacterium]